MEIESASYKSEYLEKHVERQGEGFEGFEYPPISAENYGPSGEIKKTIGNYEVIMQYRQLENYQLEIINLKLLGNNPDSGNDYLDIGKLAEEQSTRIICDPYKKGVGVAYVKSKEIYLFGDPLTKDNIITLLHEMGHCAHYESLDEQGKIDYQENYVKDTECRFDQNVAEFKLNTERSAWAYCLKKIKPLTVGDETREPFVTKKYLNNLIHNICLKNYSDEVYYRLMDRSDFADFFNEPSSQRDMAA